MSEKIIDKFEKYLLEYDGTQYDTLPKFMKRRVDALKKIQLEHIRIQHQYNKRLQELELEYEKLYQPLYEQRTKIITGEHEPTDEECQLPPNLAENEFNGDQENNSLDTPEHAFTEEDEKALNLKFKGLPAFWLGCLKSTYNFSESIETYDAQVLRYLKDVKLHYETNDDLLVYKLDFYFDENPYFSNRILTKTYHLKSNPDEKDPFNYEGFEVFKSEGCKIDWLPGKDVTTKSVTVKQKNKKNGQVREKKKTIERDSFFYFFKPPQVPEGEEIDEELGAVMAVDFELGELIRQSLIPKAALFYNGLMVEDDDDDDDDDDDGLDDEDLDSDFTDETPPISDAGSSSDECSHDESKDSLVKKGK